MFTRTFFLSLASATAFVSIVACTTTRENSQPSSMKYVDRKTACVSAGAAMAAGSANCGAIGRSYSKEDIERTGATTLAGALALMDPAITIRHYGSTTQ